MQQVIILYPETLYAVTAVWFLQKRFREQHRDVVLLPTANIHSDVDALLKRHVHLITPDTHVVLVGWQSDYLNTRAVVGTLGALSYAKHTLLGRGSYYLHQLIEEHTDVERQALPKPYLYLADTQRLEITPADMDSSCELLLAILSRPINVDSIGVLMSMANRELGLLRNLGSKIIQSRRNSNRID